MQAEQFLFLGFPPTRPKDRKLWFSSLAEQDVTTIVYEAPHRIRRTLSDLLELLGDHHIAVGRELTKAHENLAICTISQHLRLQAEPKGEYTLVIPPRQVEVIGQLTYSDDSLRKEFDHLIDAGANPRGAVRTLAKRYALPSRDVYSVVHQIRPNSG
jgi:16S rRNA (cytidine1402-2'-O)-methyltransferase